ncbi:hypothetical protein GGQ84_000652 [Desulfitispora alkaliphila]|uniref:sulfate reduction electron transfer complex DsrMKJOP subunit DsrJ n=1 Tax=Desulfitispora alkaliphila TaxID=622674 RepID=UPI003D1F9520
MQNSRNVFIGIVVFVCLLTIPFWSSLGQTSTPPEVSLDTPVIQQMDELKCIEDTEFMRSNHMEILSDWKDSVVRDGNRVYVAADGMEYEMSLQKTCMDCHSNKEQFCDSCHDFSGQQTPNCWDCHLEPKEGF